MTVIGKFRVSVLLTLPLAILSASALGSCSGNASPVGNGIMQYATLVGVSDSCGNASAVIYNPWKEGSMLQTVSLEKRPARVVVTINSIAALMDELGVADMICGVCEPEHISDTLITAMIADGRIADCGNGMYPAIERIMELKPDAILVSPFEGTGYGQLEKLGITLIQCADYMENTPLGRAEWIRFYGRLFGVAERADSLFSTIEADYMNMKELAAKTQLRPKVMLDMRSGSAWYTAGGASSIGQLIADAGGDYLFKDYQVSGSVPLQYETVFDRAHDADIWLLKNSTQSRLTYRLLEADYEGYTKFRPFMERNIWVTDVYQTPYFEETAFHPERLMCDLMTIFHPELSFARTYYRPLEE